MSEVTNVVTATFSEGCTSATVDTPLYQYDYGQTLKFEGLDLPSAYEVHFSNTASANGTAKTQIGTATGGVSIPDEYLKTGKYIYAFVYLHVGANDGETEYTVIIPVRKRPAISPEPVTPEQQSVITQTIAALQTASEEASGYAAAAEQSASNAEASAELVSKKGIQISSATNWDSSDEYLTGGKYFVGVTYPNGSETAETVRLVNLNSRIQIPSVFLPEASSTKKGIIALKPGYHYVEVVCESANYSVPLVSIDDGEVTIPIDERFIPTVTNAQIDALFV